MFIILLNNTPIPVSFGERPNEAITKRTELKEEILPNQTIQIRTTTVVEEDGVELARNHHRHVVNPGDDVTGESTRSPRYCCCTLD